MASDSSPCVSEVTSIISRIRMGNNSDITKDSQTEPDEQTPSSSSQSPETPVLDLLENHGMNSVRLRMINSAHSCSSPSIESKKPVSDIQIPIVDYEVMEARARFTVYNLRIENRSSGKSWPVFRRYTDFVRLHSKLRNEFPDIKLQLPRKRWFGDNFDPDFLSDRMKGLQEFINSILEHKELCDAPPVKDFFCLDEPPSTAESFEESRAIFEALEETIYHLRNQLSEKETELMRVKFTLDMELKKNSQVMQLLRNTVENCSACSQVLTQLQGPTLTSTPVKNSGMKSVKEGAKLQTSVGEVTYSKNKH